MYSTKLATNKQHSLKDLATCANEEHKACLAAVENALEHAQAVGEALLQAKKQCPHGMWGEWLRENFKGSHQSANVYMQVAKRWPEIEAVKSQHAGNLTIRGALKLLEPPKLEEADFDLPDLSPDLRFRVKGSNNDYIVIDPHPDHPGYYFLAHYRDMSSESPYVEFDMRGIKYYKEFLRMVLQSKGFAPSGPWKLEPATGGIPWYVPTLEERWEIERKNRAEYLQKLDEQIHHKIVEEAKGDDDAR